ncbi:hypothetical protein [Haliscomenobacter hydrossis]|uniref:Uncharacterized protein n=1 Tax=Haliscomenobacter hydrossis (strain ATCC 27775 / DSM 1100 / LMG 10767 / O) TaxID=760192 RepID=F4L3S3_HALH1|nr:hypothetical protein [Haliscomenobacter hydrossis]AEE48677.1 hypothetical protein Halhy_0770 [Haliscomenobacter hydrossis DSM 1100]
MYHSSIYIISSDEFIDLTWKDNWADFTMLQDGQPIGVVPLKIELQLAHSFTTKRGKTIVPILREAGLEVWCDGLDLASGLASGRNNDFQTAYQATNFIGWALIIVSPILFFASENTTATIVAIVVLALGPVYLWLGWKAKHTGEKIYFIIALTPFTSISMFRHALKAGIAAQNGVLIVRKKNEHND